MPTDIEESFVDQLASQNIVEAYVYLATAATKFSKSLIIKYSYEGFMGLARCLSAIPYKPEVGCRFAQLSDYVAFKQKYPAYIYKDYVRCDREEFIANLFRQALMCRRMKNNPDLGEALYELAKCIEQGAPIVPQDLMEVGGYFKSQTPDTVNRSELVRSMFAISRCRTLNLVEPGPAPVLPSVPSQAPAVDKSQNKKSIVNLDAKKQARTLGVS